MMAVESDEINGAQVIDFIKFKIEKELEKSPSGSAEYETLSAILHMYEEGVVTVRWSNNDMWVSMQDGSNVPPDLLDYSELKKELHQLEKELAHLFPEDEE